MVCMTLFLASGVVMVTLGFRSGFKRLGRIPTTRAELEVLAKSADSPWDPFSEQGGKRWRVVLWALFLALAVLNFIRAG
jgi:hypothetical protein